MKAVNNRVTVIGAGLAGSECALTLARYGIPVTLIDMKPKKNTPAHSMETFCELVCSNSLKSEELSTGSGCLKAELDILSSSVLDIARECRVPAGSALAVDRNKFSKKVHEAILNADIEVECRVVDTIPDGLCVIATGPLTDEALSAEIEKLTGQRPYFFDAAAPIVTAESIDMNKAFFGGRYGKGGDDYLNLPMTREEYLEFYTQLITAECVEVKGFEQEEVFDGCMPVEVMARRGEDTLRFGPLRPVGFRFESTRPYAVLQLRREDKEGKLYNLVGFQTHLKFPEQKRVFGLIPGLKGAEYVRYGVMHRNTYVNSPNCIGEDLFVKARDNVYFAGQITGVEGYMESIASGLVVALKIVERLKGVSLNIPKTTVLGALIDYTINGGESDYQPLNANFGILPALDVVIKDKKERKLAYSERAIRDMKEYRIRRESYGI